jgi:D-glycero-D-manno-heptose 1,7-bisphosphate phosphatase
MISSVKMVLGPPSSGKSTTTSELVNGGYISLNRDSEGGKIIDLLPKMENLLKNNQRIVLDNLFPTVEVRKPFIELSHKYNVDIEAVVMGTSIEDATFNFVNRMIKISGKFLSPEEIKKSKHPNIFPPLVMFKYKKEFQMPSTNEGFDAVSYLKFIRKDDPSFTNRALIFDYDGTLRECINGNGKYPVSEDQIELKPNRVAAIQSYLDKGYKLLGISNQSGVHKGELTHEKASQLFQLTNKLLGLDIEVEFCPHQSAPISCYCRKPQTGLFVHFMNKYKLSRKDTIFVGDMTTDATFAKRCGIQYYDQADFFK